MIDIAINLYAKMVEDGIIEFNVLPCIEGDSHRRRDTLEAHAATGGTDAGTDGLENKYDPISSVGIETTEVNVEDKIKGIAEIDLISIPYAAKLVIDRLCEGIAIAGVLGGVAI